MFGGSCQRGIVVLGIIKGERERNHDVIILLVR